MSKHVEKVLDWIEFHLARREFKAPRMAPPPEVPEWKRKVARMDALVERQRSMRAE